MLDVATPIAIGGVFLALFAANLRKCLVVAGERSGAGEGVGASRALDVLRCLKCLEC